MLMQTYPLEQNAAFLLNEEIAAYCALASDRANNSVPDSITALTPSECEINTIFPEKTVVSFEENYSDDYIHYIPAARAPELFKAAYTSPEELMEEFKANSSLAQIGLPEDFDWWGHLVEISGTTFC